MHADMVRLQEVCDYLAQRAYNESLLALWNSTTEAPTTFDDHWTTAEPLGTTLNDSLTNVTSASSQWYEVILDITNSKLRELTEWYCIPFTVVLGLFGNIWACVILHRQTSMRRNTAKLHYIQLAVDSLFLIMSLIFTQLRRYGAPGRHRVEGMQYFCLFFSLLQFCSIWLMYIMASDAYHHFKSFFRSAAIKKLKHTPRDLIIIAVFAILFHIPFIPQIRILIWKLNIYPHDPCTNPIEKHWSFTLDDVPSADIFYIVYFMLAVYLCSYALPFFLLGCRDKDIIDLTQTVQEREDLSVPAIQAGHSAFVVAILSNTTLVCYVLKLALLTFKLFDFAFHYMHLSLDRFLFINEIANLLIVVRAALNLPLMVRYSPFSRKALFKICCNKCPFDEEQLSIRIIQFHKKKKDENADGAEKRGAGIKRGIAEKLHDIRIPDKVKIRKQQ